MSNITAVVHTRNSEKTLEACLASLTWCDQVFVVDTESTDKTLDIATHFKATIFNVKVSESLRGNMVVEQIREQYLQKVKTEWTLIVDSDEEVPLTLAKKLQELMLVPSVVAYNLPRRNIIFGKRMEFTGYWPDYILRFFRTGQISHPSQIHIQPTTTGKLETLPPLDELALLHHHYESIEEFIERMNRYTNFEVEKLVLDKPNLTPLDGLQAFFTQFQSRFFAQQGYLDGRVGFMVSLLLGVYSLVAVLKATEKQKNLSSIDLNQVEEVVTKGCSSTSYWVANEQLKVTGNVFKKLGYKIRRKISS